MAGLLEVNQTAQAVGLSPDNLRGKSLLMNLGNMVSFFVFPNLYGALIVLRPNLIAYNVELTEVAVPTAIWMKARKSLNRLAIVVSCNILPLLVFFFSC